MTFSVDTELGVSLANAQAPPTVRFTHPTILNISRQKKAEKSMLLLKTCKWREQSLTRCVTGGR